MIRYFTNGRAIEEYQEFLIQPEWTEIDIPISEDGTIYPEHKNLNLVDLAKNHTPETIYKDILIDGKTKYVEDIDVNQKRLNNNSIFKQISELESLLTTRRLREATLGDESSIDFIRDIDNQIATLRSQLS